MGSTVNPRARGGASLSAELKASRDDRGQIRRLRATPPKPKAAAPAGGGVSGVTVASATPGLSGGNLIYQGWSFDTDPYGSGVAGPSLTSDSPEFDHGFTVAADGWYSFRFKQTVWFNVSASVPNGVQVELNNSRLDGVPDFFWTETLADNYFLSPGTVVGSVIDRSMGPIWCAAGDVMTPGMFWVGGGYSTAFESFGLKVYVAREG